MMTEHLVRLNVLVVDDEDDMCWTLRLIIEGAGHRCVVAKTAREALQVVGRESLHVAFVDVKLPDMLDRDGFDLVREIRSLVPELPCVLVSGFLYGDDDLVQDSLASGLIVGFIGKPFLLSQIQQVLDAVAGVIGAGARRREEMT
ncbi:MAG: response regulator [Planctomycetota bacterium]|nr:response regulator [Planctomycetota bacterium]